MFLIFDWLLLVHDFLHTPSDVKKQNVTPARHRNASSESAVVPKTVKSGVVTKRSSLPVSNERHLEVKVNVTGNSSQSVPLLVRLELAQTCHAG